MKNYRKMVLFGFLALLLIAAMLCTAASAEEDLPQIVLRSDGATEGNDLTFDVVYGQDDLVVMGLWFHKDGKTEEIDCHYAEDGKGKTINAEDMVHYEAGDFIMEVHVYDNDNGESYYPTLTVRYNRPNALTSKPRLISNENGKAVLYYPDAELFVMNTGWIRITEDGFFELNWGENDDGKYAAVVNGKRTEWLDIVITEPESQQLQEMETPTLTMKNSYKRGEPITLTVTGDPKASYSWYFEQSNNIMGTGTFPGPGTYTLDLGCLEETRDNETMYSYRVDFYLTVARPGYETSYADASFSITANEVPSAPTVTILTEEPFYQHQPVCFRIYKENATDYMALMDEYECRFIHPVDSTCEIEFDGTDEEYSRLRGGAIAFSAKVNGIWSEYSEIMYLQIEPLEPLDTPEIISRPALAFTGNQVTVRWKKVSGADRYYVSTYYYYGNDYCSGYDTTVTETSAVIPVTVNIPVTMYVSVVASGKGYADSKAGSAEIQVLKSNGTLILPDSVKEINAQAFTGVFASQIIIPDGCKTIGASAFSNMKNLIRVQIPASVTSIADTAFDGSGIRLIAAPAGSYAAKYAKNHQIPVETIP